MNPYEPDNRHYSQSQSWSPDGQQSYAPVTVAEASLSERLAFIRKVYALFFAAILFAVGGVMIGFANPELMIAVVNNRLIVLLLMIGGIFGAQAVRHVKGVNLAALFGFTTMTGIIISPLLYYVSTVNPGSIFQAGVLTVGIFGGLTAYVFISKKDFSFMRGMLTVGLIIIVVASLLNVFFVSSMGLGFAVSVGALLLFSGFVLYDTSNIMRRYPTNEYIAGALDLYLDAFNIFLALIRILNAGRR
jgi:FtsH-binding integral membrane protein